MFGLSLALMCSKTDCHASIGRSLHEGPQTKHNGASFNPDLPHRSVVSHPSSQQLAGGTGPTSPKSVGSPPTVRSLMTRGNKVRKCAQGGEDEGGEGDPREEVEVVVGRWVAVTN